LSNAVKFTAEEGAIHLEMMLEDEQNGQCTIHVLVSDTGIGISPEQQERMFTSFEQAETSTSRRYGGTGLGLFICKTIVDMMGGEIWVESELGDGTLISFTANLGYNRSDQENALSKGMILDNVRMLIADDEVGTRVFFEELNANVGISCDIATSGEDALSMIAENGAYNVYIVAQKLSDMSGIELAHSLVEHDRNAKIILMISVADWSTYQERALEAGVSAHLSKPLFVSPVIDCINELLYSDGFLEDSAEVDAAVCNFENNTVLLVEDVEINREIVMALLEPTKLNIKCAVNGIEAVDAFVSNPLKYDMIFMDIQMPEMDGFTATKLIRESGVERAKEIPIVAMTANAFKEDIEKSLASGMNDHLGKPLSYDAVIEVLKEYLGEK